MAQNEITSTEIRNLITARREIATQILNLKNEEEIVEASLKIAELTAMIRGEVPVTSAKPTRTTKIKETGDENNERVRFYFNPINAREAKSILQSAYGLTFIPNARN